MEAVPEFVLPMWVASVVVLGVALAILRSAPPTTGPAGLRGFLVPFAIPLALVAVIVLLVSGIGTLLILVRQIVEQATGWTGHAPGAVSPGAGASIAVALALALIVLLGCAYLTARPVSERK